MTGPGGPDRRGRHSSPDDGAARVRAFEPRSIDGFAPGHQAPRYEASRYEPARFAVSPRPAPAAEHRVEFSRHSGDPGQRVRSGMARSGVVDRYVDETGPMVGSGWWTSGDAGIDGGAARPLSARHSEDRRDPADPPRHVPATEHPSAPLPPRPAGVWERLSARQDGPADDDRTVASPLVPGPPVVRDDVTDAHAVDAAGWDDSDATGGLDVIGAHVDGDHYDEHAGEHLDHGELDDDDIPVVPSGSRNGGRRRRRRPLALLISLLVLGGLVVGIVLGGQKLLNLIDPASQDFTGQGSGEVEIRVREGDTLSDIARTLVDAGVIASMGPFVEAAEASPDATGIQPGVYNLREEMSGQAALDLLLDPVARLVSRVTVPEGLTADATMVRLAEATGIPVEQFEAAAADTAALGLPAYANGQLEGFLYPATYDVEPDTAPQEILRQMVGQFVEVANGVELEQRAAAVGRSPYEVVVIASMIQSETMLDEERANVAQVIYNRLAQDIPLGIDATLAYGLQKNGNDLTVSDLETDSPYNTRTRTGLPPTPISAPGEPSLEAALAPSTGTLLYYVLESEEGRHFFTDDYAAFEAARQRCAEAGLGCGG